MRFKRLNESNYRIEDCWPFKDLGNCFKLSNVKWDKDADDPEFEGCPWKAVNIEGEFVQGFLVAVDEGKFTHIKACVTLKSDKSNFGFEGFKGNDATLDEELEALKVIVTEII